MKFRYQGDAAIRHLNTRKEGDDVSIILTALRAARRMIETERAAFIDYHTLRNRGLEPDDQAIRQKYDDVLALVRDAIAAMETPKPVAFITRESMMRLSNGGNDSRGTVPVHRFASAIANRPLYLHPPESTRQPLTDDEIKRIACTPAAIPGTFIHAIVRAVERHHRIESESK